MCNVIFMRVKIKHIKHVKHKTLKDGGKLDTGEREFQLIDSSIHVTH